MGKSTRTPPLPTGVVRRLLVVTIASLLLTATVAPAVAGPDPTESHRTAMIEPSQSGPDSSGADEGDRRGPPSSANDSCGGPRVSDDLCSAAGTMEIVVHLDDPTVPAARGPNDRAGRAAYVRARQRYANRTQQRIVRYAERTDGVTLENRFWLTNAVLLTVDSDEVNVAQLAQFRHVERLSRNFEVELRGSVAAGGGSAPPQAAVAAPSATNTTYNTTYGLAQINATAVWEQYGVRGDGVKVAVLDTGVDVEHPDIDLYTENASDPTYPGGWAEFDREGDRVPESEPRDTHGHGTHTSGTVGGGNASGEYIGVAPEAELMHGMVIPGGSGTFAQVVGGMEWAVRNDADVISMSLGAFGERPEMIDPVRNAQEAGVIVVAAAGNSGEGSSGSPGNVYESFSIGATNESEGVAYFSSGERIDTADEWGSAAPASWPASYVVPDVAAPGVDVKSAVPVDGSGNPYAEYSGTSMATPHVAGAAALVLAAARTENLSVRTTTFALREMAWKPGGLPEANDTRYGAGIVDVKPAVDYVAAPQGVVGTVTGPDGTPVAGATVTIGHRGFYTQTNETGDYRLRTQPGNYTLAVTDVFGYGTASTPITVESGTFTSVDLTVERELEVAVAATQPKRIAAGDRLNVSYRVAHADNVTIELANSYAAANATLYVDGERHRFGEPIPVNGSASTIVNVSVAAESGGPLALDATFRGLGDATTVSTGPTVVVEEFVDVAVVDQPFIFDRKDSDILDAMTYPDREVPLPARYRVSSVPKEEILSAVDEYDVVVVQQFAKREGFRFDRLNETRTRTFIAEARRAGVGVVYLDQITADADAIAQKSAVTENPVQTRTGFDVNRNGTNVTYDIAARHPIVEGIGSPGESVPIYTDRFVSYTWFDEFTGQVIANVSSTTGPGGPALGVNDLTRSVYASSLGYTYAIGRSAYTPAADQILANSVVHASVDRPATLRETQDDHVRPGESITTTVAAENLTRATVTVDERASTLTADELTLTVNGDPATFGEPVTFDDYSGNVTIRVTPAENATGTLSLDHAFVGGSDRTEVTGSTGPTLIYDPPLNVPEDVPSLQDAVLLAPSGSEIVVADGTYAGPVRTGQRDGNMTIRSADGATPVIRVPESTDPWTAERTASTDGAAVSPAFHREAATGAVVIQANDSRISGFHIDAGGGQGLTIEAANVTASDVSVTNATVGISVTERDGFRSPGTEVSNVRLADVTVRDVGTGISLQGTFDEDGSANYTVTNATVENADWAGISGGYQGVTVSKSTVRNARVGINLFTSEGRSTVTETTVVNTTWVGIEAYGRTDLKNNVVRHVRSTGIAVSGYGANVTNNVVRNVSAREPSGPRAEFHQQRNAGIRITGYEVRVANNTVENASIGIGGAYGYRTQIEANTVRNASTGIRLGWLHRPEGVRNNRIRNATVGIAVNRTWQYDRFTYAVPYGEITGNDVDAKTGVRFTGDAIGPGVVRYNNLTATTTAVDGGRNQTVDARLNYFGERGPAAGAVRGNVTYDPFLTAPPAAVDRNETVALGTDVRMNATRTYALGVPGPTNQSVWDALGAEFNGTVHRYDADSGEWIRVEGNGSASELEALDAVRVTPRTDTRAVLTFRLSEYAPPDPPSDPGNGSPASAQKQLSEGWNFVAAPQYGSVDAVFNSSTDVRHVKPVYAQTASQLGPQGNLNTTYTFGQNEAGSTVSALTGYMVYADSKTTLSANLSADPTMAELYTQLGLNASLSEPEPTATNTSDEATQQFITQAAVHAAQAATNRSLSERAIEHTVRQAATRRAALLPFEVSQTVIDAAVADALRTVDANRTDRPRMLTHR